MHDHPTDGTPPGGIVIAVIDEVAPEIGGAIHYTVGAATLLGDEAVQKSALAHVLDDSRKRPYHWPEEGPHRRGRMMGCLTTIGVVARAVVVPCGRRSQEAARAVALRAILEDLVADGVTRVVIESRSAAQEGRDRALILDLLRSSGVENAFTYEWRPKEEPVLWIADTICGVVREHMERTASIWFEQVRTTTALAISYRRLET